MGVFGKTTKKDRTIPAEPPIELGKKYRDCVTGFSGTATAYSKFFNGCERVGLERGDKEGKVEESYFDIQRLEPVDAETPKPKPTGRTGGPRKSVPQNGQ